MIPAELVARTVLVFRKNDEEKGGGQGWADGGGDGVKGGRRTERKLTGRFASMEPEETLNSRAEYLQPAVVMKSKSQRTTSEILA